MKMQSMSRCPAHAPSQQASAVLHNLLLVRMSSRMPTSLRWVMFETSERCINLTMTMIAPPPASNTLQSSAANRPRKLFEACRFFFFHILIFHYFVTVAQGIGEAITKRIRRRGKKLVSSPYIAITNERNEFCKPVLQRDTPFRSASTDVGRNWGRCSVDFQCLGP